MFDELWVDLIDISIDSQISSEKMPLGVPRFKQQSGVVSGVLKGPGTYAFFKATTSDILSLKDWSNANRVIQSICQFDQLKI